MKPKHSHHSPSERTMADAALRGVVFLWLGLLVPHVLVQLTWRFRHTVPHQLRPLVIMSDEQSLVTWLTVCLGFVLGGCCLLAWRQSREWGWLWVGALFLYISLDDATMLHERIGWLVERSDGYGTVYRWVQWVGPVFAVAGIAAFVFLWRAFAGDRRRQLQILVGFGMLGMALALEVIEKPLQDHAMQWRGIGLERYTMVLEESLELLAPGMLIGAIGGLVERRLKGLK